MDLQVCRICGGITKLKNILDEDSEMINKLLVCANINMQPGDILPKLICEQCEKNLDFSYRLRKQGEATEKRLRLEIKKKQNLHNSAPAKEVNTSETESISDQSDCGKLDLSQPPKDSHERESIGENDKYNYNNFLINTSEDDCGNTLNEITKTPIVSEYCSIDLISSSGSPMSACGPDSNNDPVKATMPDGNAFSCDTCHDVFKKKKEYNMHIKQHGVERYQCIQCCKFFPSRSRLKRHEEIHNETPSHQCSYCNRNYRALYNLKRHIRAAHLGKQSWECNICNIGFSRVDVLKRHLQLHSEENKFSCAMCSQSFKTKDYLYAHHKAHHTPNSELSKNNKRTKKDSANKNQCGYCGKMFKSSFSYKNHLLIHTNEKPYKCDSCNKQFRTVAALTIHQRIHDDYRPYQCDLCLKSFRQTSHLKEHKILHLNNAPKHVCSICQAPFSRKSNLKAHIRIHTKEKPFKCAACSAEFSYMHLLQRHANKVHCRSIHKVYTMNGVDEIVGTDGGAQGKGSIETETYHYIDTVADDEDDELDNNVTQFVDFVENNQDIPNSPSPEVQVITKPTGLQHTFDDSNCAAPDTEPIVDYIEMNSLNSVQSLSDDDIFDISYEDENHTKEQKVELLVTEETKLTSTVYNVHKME